MTAQLPDFGPMEDTTSLPWDESARIPVRWKRESGLITVSLKWEGKTYALIAAEPLPPRANPDDDIRVMMLRDRIARDRWEDEMLWLKRRLLRDLKRRLFGDDELWVAAQT